MATFEPGLIFYRVRQLESHPNRWVRKAWYGRTWQAEWENVGWCPRAYTERGIHQKADRWRRRGWPTESMIARRRWLRSQITRRGVR